ncbi:MAG TPA: CsbD family protein, partial [Verrucomicrobiae bacterium]|nr:CsbD family protein [Verrucomicrobiae bacterium]
PAGPCLAVYIAEYEWKRRITHKQRTTGQIGGVTMNSDQVAGKWKQMKGKVREKWGDLTDDDLQRAAGGREQFVGILQERYGLVKEEAERQVDDFTKAVDAQAKDRFDRADRAAAATSTKR